MALGKRKLFFSFYAISSAALVFLVGVVLRSGFQSIGDGQIFVFRDGLLLFLFSIVLLYTLTLSFCSFIVKLPTIDYTSRVIAINILVYGLFGFVLTFLRIPLYSRTLIVSEFVLTTILLLSYFLIRHIFFPIRLGVIGITNNENMPSVGKAKWKYFDENDVDFFLVR